MAEIIFEKLLHSELASFLLPLLLIFVIIFGILSKIELFKNKKIDVGISLVIGLIVSSISFVSDCFSTIFSRVIILLICIFIFYVITGIFLEKTTKSKTFNFLLGTITILGMAAVIYLSSSSCGFNLDLLLSKIGEFLIEIIGVLVFIGVMFWILSGGKKSDDKGSKIPEKKVEEKKKPEAPKKEKPDEPKEDDGWEEPKESVSH